MRTGMLLDASSRTGPRSSTQVVVGSSAHFNSAYATMFEQSSPVALPSGVSGTPQSFELITSRPEIHSEAQLQSAVHTALGYAGQVDPAHGSTKQMVRGHGFAKIERASTCVALMNRTLKRTTVDENMMGGKCGLGLLGRCMYVEAIGISVCVGVR
eukprot:m.171830 g.171830  ORF g.171830 m.171830 type:complete len:156 (-) comp31663_c0_seq2:292-759(-)